MSDNEIEPNYQYLDEMLEQQGPWKGLGIKSDKNWLSRELINKNEKLNIDIIKDDIRKFTNNNDVIELDKYKIIEIVDIFNSNNYK